MEQFELDEDADSEVFALCGGVSSTRSKAGSQRGSTDNERDSASSASGESSQEAVLSQSVNTAAPPPPQPSVADFARALEQQQLPPVPPQQLPPQQPQQQSAASFELSAPAVPAAEQAAPPSSHPLPGEKRQRVERVATARPEALRRDAGSHRHNHGAPRRAARADISDAAQGPGAAHDLPARYSSRPGAPGPGPGPTAVLAFGRGVLNGRRTSGGAEGAAGPAQGELAVLRELPPKQKKVRQEREGAGRAVHPVRTSGRTLRSARGGKRRAAEEARVI
jgi:hypothetical protein